MKALASIPTAIHRRSADDIARAISSAVWNYAVFIDRALWDIEDANKAKLEGVLHNVSFNDEKRLGETKDRDARLKHLINDFHDSRLDLRPSRIGNLDVIGNCYEYLIARFASEGGKKGGEFFTPPEVSTLMAKLVNPQPNHRICDPTCASKKTKHTPAGEIPVDWGWGGCFANGVGSGMGDSTNHVGDGLGQSTNRIEGNSDHSAIGIGDGSGNPANRIGGRVGTRASGGGRFIGEFMVHTYSPSALRYVLMAFQAIL